MGLALPAELNGYPGPAHVLELAGPLGLSDGQKARVALLFESMKAEAVPLGEELIDREAVLDRLFADRRATVESIGAATAAIARNPGASADGAPEISPVDPGDASTRPGPALRRVAWLRFLRWHAHKHH
jgi:hypothetical protein